MKSVYNTAAKTLGHILELKMLYTMNLLQPTENEKLRELPEKLSEEIWYQFHEGYIDNDDEYYTFLYQWIENEIIYTHDCRKILELNEEYHYYDHDVYGRPNSIHQAAYACLYDYLMESPDTVTFEELEKALQD